MLTIAEYIERETAIKALMNDAPEQVGYSREDAADCIRYMDASDVSPVRHGRWILEREPDGKPYCFHCSVCDDDFHYIGITAAYDYCPNCGAKMDLEANHETGQHLEGKAGLAV